ncbi:GNAT family N-acetyltransferase [Nocardia sp. NPDC060259]|uniref:GNAT family N-acetyltransferase n=1 Tax=Nocardia sp. NPDC060259 TaxID=3347088 RepID=UPI00365FA459
MITTADTVQYRAPTHADLPDVHLIDGAAFPDDRYSFTALRQLIVDVGRSRSVVAVEPNGGDEEVVGYALTLMGEPGTAWLLSLAVSPDRRGRGYGHGLLLHSIAACRRMGDADEIRLTVDPKNATAYRLFRAFGFVRREGEDQYFGKGHPRDVLARKMHRLDDMHLVDDGDDCSGKDSAELALKSRMMR